MFDDVGFDGRREKRIMNLRKVCFRKPALAAVGLLVFLGMEKAASANELYYVMIFGSQSRPKLFRDTHTWATFVRTVGEGPDPRNYAIAEIHTVSWLPASLKIHTLWPIPVKGINLELRETLGVVYGRNESVTMWGPFVIGPRPFDRSEQVERILESGRARYRAVSGPGSILISDCIHAVAAIDPVFGEGHYPLYRVGKPASRYISRQIMMLSQFDQYQYDNSWLIPRLGLDRFPITFVPPQRIPKESCGLCRCPE